jgi:hypothetical protein
MMFLTTAKIIIWAMTTKKYCAIHKAAAGECLLVARWLLKLP